MAVEPGKTEGGQEERDRQACRDLGEHISGIGTEEGVCHASAESGSQTFASGLLHQNDEKQKDAGEDVNRQKKTNEKSGHRGEGFDA